MAMTPRERQAMSKLIRERGQLHRRRKIAARFIAGAMDLMSTDQPRAVTDKLWAALDKLDALPRKKR